jgi:hypothetical protein
MRYAQLLINRNNTSSTIGHIIEMASMPVAVDIVTSVDRAGLRRVLSVFATTHVQLAVTATKAIRVTSGWSLANRASMPPAMATTVAGKANGSTQQTPHASALAAAVPAVAPTIRLSGCGGWTATLMSAPRRSSKMPHDRTPTRNRGPAATTTLRPAPRSRRSGRRARRRP